MDKRVYLFELDSVRNSTEEMIRGQQALFEEVVLNGNQVVLTFNQLTDSQAFLCAIRNPTTYAQIIELFKLGRIKVSRFAPNAVESDFSRPETIELISQVDKCKKSYQKLFESGVLKSYPPMPLEAPERILRTASHYIQNSIEKCLNDSADSFLFSALPFQSRDKRILSVLLYALQYSDPSIMDTCSFQLPDEEGPEAVAAAKRRKDYTKRYIEMILQLSQEPLAANPEKTSAYFSFTDTLERFQRVFEQSAYEELQMATTPDDNDLSALLPEALELLSELKATAFNSGNSSNNRSNWDAQLVKVGCAPHVLLAEAVVDLCYNYTTEASILGTAWHYTDDCSFGKDFLCRLRSYWDDGQRGIHEFQKKPTIKAKDPDSEQFPTWDSAVRLLRNTAHKNETPAALQANAAANDSEYYGAITPRERRMWRRRLAVSLLKQLGVACVYLALFVALSYGLNELEDYLSSIGSQFQFDEFFMALTGIILFGLIGSLLSIAFGLPDILDNIKAFFSTIRDAIRLVRAPRHVAYSGAYHDVRSSATNEKGCK